MKRIMIVSVSLVAILLFFWGTAAAVPLSGDFSGYYKVGYLDGNTYVARAEMAIGAVRVRILPDARPVYFGIIADDKVYFDDPRNDSNWGVLTQLDNYSFLITGHNADTGEIREFTAVKISEEEANRILVAQRATDLEVACANNLKQMGLALNLFAKDHGGEFPMGLDELYPDYMGSTGYFICPALGGEFEGFDAHYEYIPGFRVDDPNPNTEPIVIEAPGHHANPESYLILYLDGHVQKHIETY